MIYQEEIRFGIKSTCSKNNATNAFFPLFFVRKDWVLSSPIWEEGEGVGVSWTFL